MQPNDAKRKEERLKLLSQLLDEQFGEYEELDPEWGRIDYGIDSEVVVAVERTSGRPRAILSLTHELLVDEGVPFESIFRQGIEAAKGHIYGNQRTVAIFQILTYGVRKVAE